MAEQYGAFIHSLGRGYCPIVPHLMLPSTMGFNDAIDEHCKIGSILCYDMITNMHSVELWVFGDVRSNGMNRDIRIAKQFGKPVNQQHFGKSPHDLLGGRYVKFDDHIIDPDSITVVY